MTTLRHAIPHCSQPPAVGGQFKKRQTLTNNNELKYYKTKLGYVPFDPATFREDFETIEKVMKTDYYIHKTKDIINDYEKCDILKNILLINYCSRTTYETFKNYSNGIKKTPN
jgi:hypothetical protein